MKSCLYFGDVYHRRTSPKPHAFRFRLFMVHLFLDEMEEVFRKRIFWSTTEPNLACLRRSDYHGDTSASLENSVRKTVQDQLGERPKGTVSMITHLRYFGHCFNPVTFYYCWNEDRSQPEYLLVEINNTPWNERHAKAFKWKGDDPDEVPSRHDFTKEFHVSPFIGMDVDYEWTFSCPGKKLTVNMKDKKKGEVFFQANLKMSRKPMNGANLAWALTRFPFLTIQVVVGIYFNAFLLRLKGCAFHPHPKSLQEKN